MTLQKSARGLTIATGGDSDDDTSHYENPVKLSVTAKQAPAPVVMKAAVLDELITEEIMDPNSTLNSTPRGNTR